MCKVYNQIGSLTVIKSHLKEHNVNEYKSINELINFQNSYSISRQQIILNHQLLIEQEKVMLTNQLVELEYSIKNMKIEVEQQLSLELQKLRDQLDNLSSEYFNAIQTIINYIKKAVLKQKIWNNKRTFNLKVVQSLKYVTENYNIQNNRHQYVVSCFDDAVKESSLPQLKELDRKKRIIDQINNSIYGAIGEQKVGKELEKLSDDYILINDFSYRFNPPIYNRKENDYIKSIQIDHILVSPSGIFIIETKNWSQKSINDLNLYSPVQQIKRTNFALYKMLNVAISNSKLSLIKHHWGDRKIPIRNLIVLINQKPIEEFQYVKILTLNNLRNYVSYIEPCFSSKDTHRIADYLLNLIGK